MTADGGVWLAGVLATIIVAMVGAWAVDIHMRVSKATSEIAKVKSMLIAICIKLRIPLDEFN